MSKKLDLSRRALFRGAGVAVGSQIVSGALGQMAALFPDSAGLPLIGQLLAAGDPSALAAGAASTAKTLVSFGMIDKVQPAMLFNYFTTGDAVPTGLDGQDGLALKPSTFRNLNLTSLFGDELDLPDRVGIAFHHMINSQAGGHSLAGVQLTKQVGSIHNAYERWCLANHVASPLGPIGFAVRSDANDSSEMFIADNGRRMQTYRNVSELTAAIASLRAPTDEAKALLYKLDRLAKHDVAIRDRFYQLTERVDAVLRDLAAAAADPSYVMQQARAIVALSKAGLCQNAMMAAGWDDTNGGGNLNTKGGEKQRSPIESVKEIAKAISFLARELPDLVLVAWSDGSRTFNNGDSAGGTPLFLVGDAAKVKTTVAYPLTENVANMLGRQANGMQTVHANLFATALQVAGADTHDVPVLKELLV